MDQWNVFTLFLVSMVVYNISLLYGTVGEILTEKSGSLNLGVEGIMAIGAMGGYLAGCAFDNLLIGILAAFFFAALCGLLFAWLTVSLQANQNVTGLTITTFGLGLYFFLGSGLKAAGKWPELHNLPNLSASIAEIKIPLLSDIPVIGRVLFQQNILVYLGILIAIIAFLYLRYTKIGLKTRAIGENPAAADAVGVNITRYKYLNIIVGAGIMGIGGYQMGLNLGGSFEGSNCWIGGYGWISIALVIFANWNPAWAILGTFVFGFFSTLKTYGTSLATAFPGTLGWLSAIPPQFLQALPFIITALILVIKSISKNKHNAQPAAMGVGYYREDR